MASFLERLRGKSEAARTRYLFISVGVSFLFVVAIWASSLTVSLGTLLEKDATGTVREGFRTLTGNAPDSLEALLKSGSVLSEEGRALGEMMKNPPKDEALKSAEETADTLPKSETFVDEGSVDSGRHSTGESVKESIAEDAEESEVSSEMPKP